MRASLMPSAVALLLLQSGAEVLGAPTIDSAEVRAIAKEAYIYGYPIADHYRIQHAYFVDRASADFKAPWNELKNMPRLKKDADGGLTLHIQHESPGADRESNWLPAPKGPFWCAMRLYWPKEEALSGAWKQPALQPVR